MKQQPASSWLFRLNMCCAPMKSSVPVVSTLQPERQFASFLVFLFFFLLLLSGLVLLSCEYYYFFPAEVEGSLWIFSGWARPHTWHWCVSGQTKEAAAAPVRVLASPCRTNTQRNRQPEMRFAQVLNPSSPPPLSFGCD